jgi:DNA-binding beta-propeller fold protein YncE
MPKVKTQVSPFCFFLVLAVFSFISVSHAWSGGLSWGPVVEDPSSVSCVPEESPLLVKGPIKSPMRMAEYGDSTALLSDRSGSIYEISYLDPANPVLLFQIDGSPLGIAFDGRNILVGNETSGKIEQYALRRDRVRKKGSFPKSRSARIQPLDIAVDDAKGMTFVVDGVDSDVKVYNSRGRLTLSIGSFGQLTQPQALTLNPEAEELIVTDYGDQRIGVSASLQVFDYSGRHLKTIHGSFSRPQGVWAKGQSIYLVDAMLGQVMEYDRDNGSLLSTHGCFGASDGHLMLPMDVLYDSKLKQFFVADNRNGRVSVLPLTEQ